MKKSNIGVSRWVVIGLVSEMAIASAASFKAQDPGLRSGPAGVGAPLAGLTASQLEFFTAAELDFATPAKLTDGLGPRMNLDSCGGCHAQPALGGTSPAVNPQVAFTYQGGGTDSVPPFISANGPVREARFVSNADGTPDGGVHSMFTLTGRLGAAGCTLATTKPRYQATT
jgi:hypothetical protein